MAKKQSPKQREIVARVMHGFKHGELDSSSGRKVENPRQAIAIALHEAGASRDETPAGNKRNLARMVAKERRAEAGREGGRRRKPGGALPGAGEARASRAVPHDQGAARAGARTVTPLDEGSAAVPARPTQDARVARTKKAQTFSRRPRRARHPAAGSARRGSKEARRRRPGRFGSWSAASGTPPTVAPAALGRSGQATTGAGQPPTDVSPIRMDNTAGSEPLGLAFYCKYVI